jgi:hypothetical protein
MVAGKKRMRQEEGAGDMNTFPGHTHIDLLLPTRPYLLLCNSLVVFLYFSIFCLKTPDNISSIMYVYA